MNQVTATILAVFFPGAGQMSNAQPLKGLAAMALTFISLFVLNLGFDVFPYLFWLVWAASIIDAFLVGKKRDARREPVRKGGAIAGGVLNVVMYVAWAVLAVVISFFSPSESEQSDIAQQVEQKLHDRYHQDFTVKVKDSNMFETGLFYMDATPKSDPSIQFHVEMSRDGSTFQENYETELLLVQGLPVMQKRVDEAFATDHLVYVLNNTDGNFEADKKNELPLGFGDMVAKYPDKLRQDVRIYLFGTYSQEKEQQTMESAMRFLSGFSDAEKKNLAFEIDWFDPAMKDKLTEKTGAAMYDYTITHSDDKKAFFVNVWNGEAPKIKTIEDLKQYKDKL